MGKMGNICSYTPSSPVSPNSNIVDFYKYQLGSKVTVFPSDKHRLSLSDSLESLPQLCLDG